MSDMKMFQISIVIEQVLEAESKEQAIEDAFESIPRGLHSQASIYDVYEYDQEQEAQP